MKSVAQRYAQGRNLARCQSGRLFEERYFSTPILTERQLAVTTAYVELNPVRAGMVDDASRHRWSTFALHAGRPEASQVPSGLWTPSEWYLSLGPDRGSRAEAYTNWLRAVHDRDERPERLSPKAAAVFSAAAADPRRIERPDGTSAV